MRGSIGSYRLLRHPTKRKRFSLPLEAAHVMNLHSRKFGVDSPVVGSLRSCLRIPFTLLEIECPFFRVGAVSERHLRSESCPLGAGLPVVPCSVPAMA